MAKNILVAVDGGPAYEIRLACQFSALGAELGKLGYHSGQKICVVTDSQVDRFYSKEVLAALAPYFETVKLHVFPAGEASKNLDTVNRLYEDLIKSHFGRQDFLVALGGGVVGDLTGFAAATYLRGIDFIQVPTTLLSQVDSSIGGKTGVDFMQYKNMVGAFYQPRLVYINLETLKSLPKEQLLSGMGEVLKHGLIKDGGYFSWICKNQEAILALDMDVMEELVYQSCQIKRAVVERDPKEQGERALLNFGHTIGHAVEKLSGFELLHGECVALGMIAASYLSAKYSSLSEDEAGLVQAALKSFGFCTRVFGLKPEDILFATKSDKKMVGDRIKFILLSAIGNSYICRDLTEAQILEAIRYVCGEG